MLTADAAIARHRRQAGLASNNLEASLQRAMHEPRRGQRDRLQATLVADATLRRIAGRLATISLNPSDAGNELIREWVPAALRATAEGAALPERPVMASGDLSLDRLARMVELLGVTLSGRKEAVLF